MAENVRLYAGTQHGLVVFQQRNGGWDQVSHEFPDGCFDTITGSRQRPERVYTAVAWDGLYRTDDGGGHWKKLMDGEIRAITIDPNDENVVYVGTEPVHLYRSEDGGDHWEELTGLQNVPDEVRKQWWTPYPPATGHVRYVFVHDTDSNFLSLCLEHGGVLRSFDRGQTWEDVSEGIDYLDMHMVKSLPGRKDRFYCSSARGFFTSEDPGTGWVRAEEGMTRDYSHDFVFLPPARADEQPTMLVATANGSPGFWRREERAAQSAIFRSFDAARSWQRVAEGLPESMDHMVWALANHPTDPNTVFAGIGPVNRGQTVDTRTDVSPALADGPGDIYLSRDRGESWERLPIDLPADRVLWVAAS